MCKLKAVITSEKRILRKRNDLYLIIFASNYYCFWTNIKTWVLKIWKNKENFQDMVIFQDMEGLVLNGVVIQYMKIFQDMDTFLDMENLLDLEANTTHSIP